MPPPFRVDLPYRDHELAESLRLEDLERRAREAFGALERVASPGLVALRARWQRLLGGACALVFALAMFVGAVGARASISWTLVVVAGIVALVPSLAVARRWGARLADRRARGAIRRALANADPKDPSAVVATLARRIGPASLVPPHLAVSLLAGRLVVGVVVWASGRVSVQELALWMAWPTGFDVLLVLTLPLLLSISLAVLVEIGGDPLPCRSLRSTRLTFRVNAALGALPVSFFAALAGAGATAPLVDSVGLPLVSLGAVALGTAVLVHLHRRESRALPAPEPCTCAEGTAEAPVARVGRTPRRAVLMACSWLFVFAYWVVVMRSYEGRGGEVVCRWPDGSVWLASPRARGPWHPSEHAVGLEERSGTIDLARLRCDPREISAADVERLENGRTESIRFVRMGSRVRLEVFDEGGRSIYRYRWSRGEVRDLRFRFDFLCLATMRFGLLLVIAAVAVSLRPRPGRG